MADDRASAGEFVLPDGKHLAVPDAVAVGTRGLIGDLHKLHIATNAKFQALGIGPLTAGNMLASGLAHEVGRVLAIVERLDPEGHLGDDAVFAQLRIAIENGRDIARQAFARRAS